MTFAARVHKLFSLKGFGKYMAFNYRPWLLLTGRFSESLWFDERFMLLSQSRLLGRRRQQTLDLDFEVIILKF